MKHRISFALSSLSSVLKSSERKEEAEIKNSTYSGRTGSARQKRTYSPSPQCRNNASECPPHFVDEQHDSGRRDNQGSKKVLSQDGGDRDKVVQARPAGYLSASMAISQ